MIKFDQLHKHFGKVRAVDGISIEIKEGELFCFLGPNGAGKTTTIKMMVGLMTPTNGNVHINGINVVKEPEQAKALIGYVPDSAFLYQQLTGTEFLQMVGQLYNMEPGELQLEQEKLTEELGMGEWLKDRIGGYSQGMKQRLSFAAAFIHKPIVLVIDEPMVGLDPRTARTIKDMLKERSDAGVTLFISTHNLNVAEELAHRIAIINRGKILGIGPINSFRTQSRDGHTLEELFLEIVAEEEGEV